MFSLLLLGVFGLPIKLGIGDNVTQLVMLGVIAFAIYLLTRRLAGETLPTALGKLPERAANLLRHIDSLGLPMLATLLKHVSERNWVAVPGDLQAIFDSLDDKSTRGPILDQLFSRQLERQLSDPERRDALVRRLEARLGGTFTPSTPA